MFRYYCSGRKDVTSIEATFILKRRYNLFTRWFGNDVVKYNVITDLQIPFVMAICDKKQLKQIKKKHLDLNFFADPYPDEIENKSLGLLTEDYTAFKTIFGDTNIKKIFSQLCQNIYWLHITDRKNLNKYETNIIFTVTFPKNKEESNLHLNLLHLLVDKLKSTKFSDLVFF